MDVQDFVTQFEIGALRVHLPPMDCDCDAVASTESFDDGANGCRVVKCAAFLRFSLRVRPANCPVSMYSMVMRSDCMRPMCTFPLAGSAAHSRTVACSLWHEYCSMKYLAYCW